MSVDLKIDRLLTVQDISSLLNVTKEYVYNLTYEKKIPHLKIHGHLRFRWSDIDEWLKSKEVQIDCKEEEHRDRDPLVY